MTTSEVRHNCADPLWQPETGRHRSDTPKGGCLGACVAVDNESPVSRSHADGEEAGEAVDQEGRHGEAEKCQEEHEEARQKRHEKEGQQAQGRKKHEEKDQYYVKNQAKKTIFLVGKYQIDKMNKTLQDLKEEDKKTDEKKEEKADNKKAEGKKVVSPKEEAQDKK